VVDVVAQLEEWAAANPQKPTGDFDRGSPETAGDRQQFRGTQELATDWLPWRLMGDSAGRMNPVWPCTNRVAEDCDNGGNIPVELLD